MRYLYISAVIFILGYFSLLNTIRDVCHTIFGPFQYGLRDVAMEIRGVGTLLGGVEKLRKEHISLIEENLILRSQIQEYRGAEEENKVLKEQLDLKKAFDRELLLATVMGNPSDLTGTSFIVDRGTRDGVKKGDNIIRGNYLVGVVKEPGTYRSLANFISSSEVSITVTDIDVPGRTEGVVEGQYGSSILMKRVLPTEEIHVGDTIITSGKDGIFIPGLIVGKVSEVLEVPSETLKSAYLEPYIHIGKLTDVFIMTN